LLAPKIGFRGRVSKGPATVCAVGFVNQHLDVAIGKGPVVFRSDDPILLIPDLEFAPDLHAATPHLSKPTKATFGPWISDFSVGTSPLSLKAI
jgi:hypothetical protein